jgi:hypothetical protein
VQTSGGMWLSIALAVVMELPLAFLLLNAARRIIRLSALVPVSERDGDVHLPCCGGYLWWVRTRERRRARRSRPVPLGRRRWKNVTASGGALS